MNIFQWPRQPPEILLAEFGSEVRLFPLGVCQRPLPSWVPWGFQLVRHLLSCLGCCRREKIAAVCVRSSCVLVRKPAIVFFPELRSSWSFYSLSRRISSNSPFERLPNLLGFGLYFWLLCSYLTSQSVIPSLSNPLLYLLSVPGGRNSAGNKTASLPSRSLLSKRQFFKMW